VNRHGVHNRNEPNEPEPRQAPSLWVFVQHQLPMQVGATCQSGHHWQSERLSEGRSPQAPKTESPGRGRRGPPGRFPLPAESENGEFHPRFRQNREEAAAGAGNLNRDSGACSVGIFCRHVPGLVTSFAKLFFAPLPKRVYLCACARRRAAVGLIPRS
jgi:hypothetical protein